MQQYCVSLRTALPLLFNRHKEKRRGNMKTFVTSLRLSLAVILLAGLSFAQTVPRPEAVKPSAERTASKRKSGRPKLRQGPSSGRAGRTVNTSVERIASTRTVISPESDRTDVAPDAANSGEESPAANAPKEPATTKPVINGIKFGYATAPTLAVELAQYITSDTKAPKSFRLSGTLANPLQSENGEIIAPAQTQVTINAHVRPGKRLGKAGEIIFSLEPIILQENRSSGQGEEAGGIGSKSLLQQSLSQSRWLVTFSHKLDYAATPEEKEPRILVVKPKSEGLPGCRGCRPSQVNDSSNGSLDIRAQTAAYHIPKIGLVYDVGTATASLMRTIFSKKNLFLPIGTKLYFQLDKTIHLKRLSEEPGSMKLYYEGESSGKAVSQNKPINPK
jgi:hypothetical protein